MQRAQPICYKSGSVTQRWRRKVGGLDLLSKLDS